MMSEPLRITDDLIRRVTRVDDFKSIKSLDLFYRRTNEHKIVKIENMSKLTQLESLNLSYHSIKYITSLSSLTNLQSLNLMSNHISTVEKLDGLINLITLNLTGNRIDRITQAITSCRKLQVLRLGRNMLDDLGQITILGHLPNLTDLTLYGNPFCKLGHYRLFVIYSIPSLQTLDGKAVTTSERDNAEKQFHTRYDHEHDDDHESSSSLELKYKLLEKELHGKNQEIQRLQKQLEEAGGAQPSAGLFEQDADMQAQMEALSTKHAVAIANLQEEYNKREAEYKSHISQLEMQHEKALEQCRREVTEQMRTQQTQNSHQEKSNVMNIEHVQDDEKVKELQEVIASLQDALVAEKSKRFGLDKAQRQAEDVFPDNGGDDVGSEDDDDDLSTASIAATHPLYILHESLSTTRDKLSAQLTSSLVGGTGTSQPLNEEDEPMDIQAARHLLNDLESRLQQALSQAREKQQKIAELNSNDENMGEKEEVSHAMEQLFHELEDDLLPHMMTLKSEIVKVKKLLQMAIEAAKIGREKKKQHEAASSSSSPVLNAYNALLTQCRPEELTCEVFSEWLCRRELDRSTEYASMLNPPIASDTGKSAKAEQNMAELHAELDRLRVTVGVAVESNERKDALIKQLTAVVNDEKKRHNMLVKTVMTPTRKGKRRPPMVADVSEVAQNLQQTIAEQEEQLRVYEARLHLRDDTVNTLQQGVSQMDNFVGVMRHHVKELDDELLAIHQQHLPVDASTVEVLITAVDDVKTILHQSVSSHSGDSTAEENQEELDNEDEAAKVDEIEEQARSLAQEELAQYDLDRLRKRLEEEHATVVFEYEERIAAVTTELDELKETHTSRVSEFEEEVAMLTAQVELLQEEKHAQAVSVEVAQTAQLEELAVLKESAADSSKELTRLRDVEAHLESLQQRYDVLAAHTDEEGIHTLQNRLLSLVEEVTHLRQVNVLYEELKAAYAEDPLSPTDLKFLTTAEKRKQEKKGHARSHLNTTHRVMSSQVTAFQEKLQILRRHTLAVEAELKEKRSTLAAVNYLSLLVQHVSVAKFRRFAKDNKFVNGQEPLDVVASEEQGVLEVVHAVHCPHTFGGMRVSVAHIEGDPMSQSRCWCVFSDPTASGRDTQARHLSDMDVFQLKQWMKLSDKERSDSVMALQSLNILKRKQINAKKSLSNAQTTLSALQRDYHEVRQDVDMLRKERSILQHEHTQLTAKRAELLSQAGGTELNELMTQLRADRVKLEAEMAGDMNRLAGIRERIVQETNVLESLKQQQLSLQAEWKNAATNDQLQSVHDNVAGLEKRAQAANIELEARKTQINKLRQEEELLKHAIEELSLQYETLRHSPSSAQSPPEQAAEERIFDENDNDGYSSQDVAAENENSRSTYPSRQSRYGRRRHVVPIRTPTPERIRIRPSNTLSQNVPSASLSLSSSSQMLPEPQRVPVPVSEPKAPQPVASHRYIPPQQASPSYRAQDLRHAKRILAQNLSTERKMTPSASMRSPEMSQPRRDLLHELQTGMTLLQGLSRRMGDT